MKSYNLEKPKLSTLLLFLCFLFSSFDIFGNLEILGFNIRFFYVLSFFLLIIFLVQNKNVIFRYNVSFILILVWLFLQFVSIFNSLYFLRGLGYIAWLILNIIMLYSSFYVQQKDVKKIFKLYIISFVVLSLVGIVQFILSYVGVNFYIYSYWNLGWVIVPRIRGFNFESSFYAMYLVPGLVGAFFCYEYKIFWKRFISLSFFVIILIAILMSSSRITILLLTVFVFGYYFLKNFKKVLIKRSMNIRDLFIFMIILVIFSVSLLFISSNKVLLFGTGIGNLSNSSVSTRFRDMQNTIKVFRDNPLFGVSLGGVASNIALNNGVYVNSNDVISKNEGLNVVLEVLAGSGVIGFIPFVLSFILLIKNIVSKIKHNTWSSHIGNKVISYSILIGFFLQLCLLLFSQNILRPYFWIQIWWILILLKMKGNFYEE